MKLSTITLLALTSPSMADTFAERWPQPRAVDPAPVADPAPVLHQRIRIAHAERFVCHRQTYYRGRHRYWRCQR